MNLAHMSQGTLPHVVGHMIYLEVINQMPISCQSSNNQMKRLRDAQAHHAGAHIWSYYKFQY